MCADFLKEHNRDTKPPVLIEASLNERIAPLGVTVARLSEDGSKITIGNDRLSATFQKRNGRKFTDVEVKKINQLLVENDESKVKKTPAPSKNIPNNQKENSFIRNKSIILPLYKMGVEISELAGGKEKHRIDLHFNNRCYGFKYARDLKLKNVIVKQGISIYLSKKAARVTFENVEFEGQTSLYMENATEIIFKKCSFPTALKDNDSTKSKIEKRDNRFRIMGKSNRLILKDSEGLIDTTWLSLRNSSGQHASIEFIENKAALPDPTVIKKYGGSRFKRYQTISNDKKKSLSSKLEKIRDNLKNGEANLIELNNSLKKEQQKDGQGGIFKRPSEKKIKRLEEKIAKAKATLKEQKNRCRKLESYLSGESSYKKCEDIKINPKTSQLSYVSAKNRRIVDPFSSNLNLDEQTAMLAGDFIFISRMYAFYNLKQFENLNKALFKSLKDVPPEKTPKETLEKTFELFNHGLKMISPRKKGNDERTRFSLHGVARSFKTQFKRYLGIAV